MKSNEHWLKILTLAFATCLTFAGGVHADPGQSFWSIYVGNYWNYNGTGPGYSWTTHDEFVSTETVSQHNTFKLQKTGGQFIEYEWYEVTLPEIKIWKKTYYDDDIPGYVTVTLDAGLPVGKNPIVVGSWTNSTSATGTVGIDSFPGTVWLAVNVLASENVTTPMGTYTAYKVQYTYTVYSPTAGYYRTLTEYKWFIPSLGVVKWEDLALGETELITSMNVKKWKVGFDGDGKTDILWRHTASGTVAVWLMNGTAVSSVGMSGAIAADWQIKDVGDFNGNGKTDVLWQNTSGTVAIWFMNGTTVSSVAIAGATPSDWQFKGIGDFNADGKADILWQHPASGTVAVWIMNGSAISSIGLPGAIPSDWQIKGIGDLDGDSKADILWQHPASGTVAVWIMNGSAISSIGLPGAIPSDWQIKGVGDFDADGKADVLWQHPATGTVAVWIMNGAAISSIGVPGAIPSDWQIKGVGDYNGDGKADVLWQQTSGTVAVWLMNGKTISSIGVSGSVGIDWQIAN